MIEDKTGPHMLGLGQQEDLGRNRGRTVGGREGTQHGP